MITAITYRQPTWILKSYTGELGEHSISRLIDNLKAEADFVDKSQRLIEFLNKDLSCSNIEQVIRTFFGEAAYIEIKPLNKRSRVYYISGGIWIYEKD